MLAEAARAVSGVMTALQRASAATGTDFHYLLGTAMRESGLKPQAQSATSSASGLFQFVEQTWLRVVKEFGARHGLSSYANAISKGSDGRFHAGQADRGAILALRTDPQISALMAGEYARQTQGEMEQKLGRPVSGGELYAAHLLGSGGACRLIQMNGSAPGSPACDLFPKAADANRSIFFRADGSPKSVHEVYDFAVNHNTSTAVPAAQAVPMQYGSLMDDGTAALLASLWSDKGFFSSGEKAAQPFGFSPALLQVLSAAAGSKKP
jgi:hypothetical protein